MALKIVNKNILMALADVVVNSANPEPVMAQHGVEREIYENAGAQELLQERARIGKIDYGWVEETPSFKLSGQNIKRIYHAVCCPWVDGNSFEEETLKCCYLNALRKMKADACESISFPLLGAGNLGFPTDIAITTAITQINYFLETNPSKRVYLCIPDPKLFKKALSFQDYMDSGRIETSDSINSLATISVYPYNDIDYEHDQIQRVKRIWRKYHNGEVLNLDEKLRLGRCHLCFSNLLQLFSFEKEIPLYEITKTGVMSKAKLSRIINRESNIDKKETVLAFGIYLKLTSKEMDLLMTTAGFAFRDHSASNIIVKDFLDRGRYSFYDINSELVNNGEKALFTDYEPKESELHEL